MQQRIRNKAAESLKQRSQRDEVVEAVKVEAVFQDPVVRLRCTIVERNLNFTANTHVSSSTARKDLKQAMLAKAAKDRDVLIKNSEGKTFSTSSSRDGQGTGQSGRPRGHGLGNDLRREATASYSERAAVLRLLAS